MSEYWPMIPPAVICDHTLTPLDVCVYAALAQYADMSTGECYPLQTTLADDLGVTDRTIRDHIARLVKAGHVEKLKRRRRDSIVYRIHVRPTESRPEQSRRSKNQDRNGGAVKTGRAAPETFKHTNELKRSNELAQCEAAKPGYSMQFLKWWEAYPRKVAKAAAAAAFERAVRVIGKQQDLSATQSCEWLLGQTQAFRVSDKGRSGKFCPYPATWLNQGRYDDDPSEWNETSDATTDVTYQAIEPA